jgi:tetratricopeptide (TPR) repeat protein
MESRLLFLLMTLAVPSRADDLDSQAAKKHYAEGSKAFSLGELDRAVEEYKAAYNLAPEPALLYNIGQAFRLGGKLRQAQFFYRSYLHSLPNAENRAEVEGRIKAIEEQLRAEKAVTNQPPNTTAPEPQAAPQASPAPQVIETAKTPVETAPRTPLVKRWWLWTAVGVAAGVALGVGLGVGLTNADPRAPSSALGSAQVFY